MNNPLVCAACKKMVTARWADTRECLACWHARCDRNYTCINLPDGRIRLCLVAHPDPGPPVVAS
jgi:hypothetical protein